MYLWKSRWGRTETKFAKLIHLPFPHTLFLSLPHPVWIVFDTEIHMLAGADTPAPTGCSTVRATEIPLAPIRDCVLPSGPYKNNGKPTIDRNFFKSMARTIKANRTCIADAEVVDQEACKHYTGYYTSNSCGEETRYVNWIEGDALRMRIELKFRLIHERMLAPEASNNRRLRR